jgi:release factor glutamine methyltransferase
MILDNAIQQGSKILKKNNIKTHELDAQIILSNIMKVTREFLISNNYINISEEIIQKYNQAIERRIKKEPVAYITGKKEFWSKNFIVSDATLIPRPETELLLYKIVKFFKNKSINILDIGTGSGCILLSILKELHLSTGTGIDISAKAIKVAELNARKLNLFDRANFKVFDIKNFGTGKYDLIISNPPYIPLKDIKNLSKDIINYEPLIALKAGFDGLDLIKKVIYKSSILLKRNGMLAIEIGEGQYLKVSNLLKHNGVREVSKVYDYNRNVRCIIGTKL